MLLFALAFSLTPTSSRGGTGEVYFADVPTNSWQILDTGAYVHWNVTIGRGKPSFKRSYCTTQNGLNGTFNFQQIGTNAVGQFEWHMGAKMIDYKFSLLSPKILGTDISTSGQLGYGFAETIVPGLQLCIQTECNLDLYCIQFE